jgi:hypothetical protein
MLMITLGSYRASLIHFQRSDVESKSVKKRKEAKKEKRKKEGRKEEINK